MEAPERLTPRSRRVRPALSTKLKDVVCIYDGCRGFPVAGDVEGTCGIAVVVVERDGVCTISRVSELG